MTTAGCHHFLHSLRTDPVLLAHVGLRVVVHITRCPRLVGRSHGLGGYAGASWVAERVRLDGPGLDTSDLQSEDRVNDQRGGERLDRGSRRRLPVEEHVGLALVVGRPPVRLEGGIQSQNWECGIIGAAKSGMCAWCGRTGSAKGGKSGSPAAQHHWEAGCLCRVDGWKEERVHTSRPEREGNEELAKTSNRFRVK